MKTLLLAMPLLLRLIVVTFWLLAKSVPVKLVQLGEQLPWLQKVLISTPVPLLFATILPLFPKVKPPEPSIIITGLVDPSEFATTSLPLFPVFRLPVIQTLPLRVTVQLLPKVILPVILTLAGQVTFPLLRQAMPLSLELWVEPTVNDERS